MTTTRREEPITDRSYYKKVSEEEYAAMSLDDLHALKNPLFIELMRLNGSIDRDMDRRAYLTAELKQTSKRIRTQLITSKTISGNCETIMAALKKKGRQV